MGQKNAVRKGVSGRRFWWNCYARESHKLQEDWLESDLQNQSAAAQNQSAANNQELTSIVPQIAVRLLGTVVDLLHQVSLLQFYNISVVYEEVFPAPPQHCGFARKHSRCSLAKQPLARARRQAKCPHNTSGIVTHVFWGLSTAPKAFRSIERHPPIRVCARVPKFC